MKMHIINREFQLFFNKYNIQEYINEILTRATNNLTPIINNNFTLPSNYNNNELSETPTLLDYPKINSKIPYSPFIVLPPILDCDPKKSEDMENFRSINTSFQNR